ncbi:hypothetical protein BV20DRAFT_260531 [Pilatotrama ljubarskyi]|nr:hypothetical protein BV20DRAFT_260531 [Pilatotrama ljubarskyi]
MFHRLDHGGGKSLSLKECPREQLEKERITYLSPEQRLNYLVTIDSDGKLRWARNGQLVDTTAGRWKDAGGGRGIVPYDEPDGDSEPRDSFSAPSPSSSSSSSISRDADAEMMHYVGLHRQPKNPVKRVLWKNFTLRGLFDKMLRKTIKRNTWIYVSDKNCSYNQKHPVHSTGFDHPSTCSLRQSTSTLESKLPGPSSTHPS